MGVYRKKSEDITRRILLFVILSIELRGMPPTVREIAKFVGLKSLSRVIFYLRKLKDKGKLSFRFARTKRCARGL